MPPAPRPPKPTTTKKKAAPAKVTTQAKVSAPSKPRVSADVTAGKAGVQREKSWKEFGDWINGKDSRGGKRTGDARARQLMTDMTGLAGSTKKKPKSPAQSKSKKPY